MYNLKAPTEQLPLLMFNEFTIVNKFEYQYFLSNKESLDGTLEYVLNRICRLKEYTLAFDSTSLELRSTTDVSVDSWHFNISC